MTAMLRRRGRISSELQDSEHEDWRNRAACRHEDPDLFFSNFQHEIEQAVSICTTCPVTAECGQFASEHGESDGVWGGEPEHVRRNRMAGELSSGKRLRAVNVCEQCGFPFRIKKRGQRFCSPVCHHTWRKAQPSNDCGSLTAARRHRGRREPLDAACRLAEAMYRARKRAEQKGRTQ